VSNANIPDAADRIPMMFRSQIPGRCQLQYAASNDAETWVDEWVDRAYSTTPNFGEEVRTQTYQFNWRFVTNGGQDDGIIRPVIGAYGRPFYPGSSMKGIFASACDKEKRDRYCGETLPDGDVRPGILRFHGGYPIDDSWQENLLDIVHPQQDRQVKGKRGPSAFAQISLYRPTLCFGISSSEELDAQEWEEIWQIWENAIAKGLGCRVSAGYGHPQQSKPPTKPFYRCRIKGQGAAPKLLDGTGEFRPNMLKAGIRGHALRIFGGLTDAETADRLVGDLFGDIHGETRVGLLAMDFDRESLQMETFGSGSYAVPTYEVEGKLAWKLTRSLPEPQRKTLKNLISSLTRFSLLLGGFGKSWRRADHRLFYPEYYDLDKAKPLIGCHWQWKGERSQVVDNKVRKLSDVATFIEETRSIAKEWMKQQNVKTNKGFAEEWREAWHPRKVQVWGRVADSAEESDAIAWLHRPYRHADPPYQTEGSIYRTSVTGKLGEIGHLWHRMYPVVLAKRDPENPRKPKIIRTRRYLELLSVFPDGSPECDDFLQFLDSALCDFELLWPEE